MKWEAMKRTFSKLPRGARRKMLHAIPAQYELIGCYAGLTEPVHDKILELNYRQYEIPGERAVRYPDFRHPGHLAL
jgi:hypothetical protein